MLGWLYRMLIGRFTLSPLPEVPPLLPLPPLPALPAVPKTPPPKYCEHLWTKEGPYTKATNEQRQKEQFSAKFWTLTCTKCGDMKQFTLQ